MVVHMLEGLLDERGADGRGLVLGRKAPSHRSPAGRLDQLTEDTSTMRGSHDKGIPHVLISVSV